jgi:hypothetical protein
MAGLWRAESLVNCLDIKQMRVKRVTPGHWIQLQNSRLFETFNFVGNHKCIPTR